MDTGKEFDKNILLDQEEVAVRVGGAATVERSWRVRVAGDGT